MVGTKLAPRGEDFTIQLPGEEWIWVVPKEQALPAAPHTKRIYSAFNVRTKEVLSLYVIPDPGGHLVNEEFMRGLEAGYRGKTEASRDVKSFVYAAVDEPLIDSYAFEYIIDRTDGRSLHYFGYASGNDPKYLFTCMSTQPEEPIVLARWISSFQILE
jgi:hypothetical protein